MPEKKIVCKKAADCVSMAPKVSGILEMFEFYNDGQISVPFVYMWSEQARITRMMLLLQSNRSSIVADRIPKNGTGILQQEGVWGL